MSARTTVTVGDQTLAVAVARRGDAIEAHVDDRPIALGVERDGPHWRVALGDRTVGAVVVRERDAVWVAIEGEVYRCAVSDEARRGGAAGGVQSPRVSAPMPGKVLAVRVAIGQQVAAGDPLVVLEAMKMETIVIAEAAARVAHVHVAAGAMVEPGQVLVELAFEPAVS
jgi:acetyl-CoA/propionyl-CoA carboxylase biotin carboxyl carrier protein